VLFGGPSVSESGFDHHLRALLCSGLMWFSGVASATFEEGPEGGQFFFREVTYAFMTPEPVPEPTSLLLLATSLIAAGVRGWRSRIRR
jgi:hypothetical protein